MSKIGNSIANLISKYLPSALTIAVLLTILVLVAGIVFEKATFVQMITFWGDGLWRLLTFAMQMVLILVAGGTLAKANSVQKVLDKLGDIPTGNTQVVLMATILSCTGCYINWGFGLIISAIFGVILIKRQPNVDRGLVLAASYSGFLVWHGGLSGSIPLKLTSPSQKIQEIIGESSIGLDQTIFSGLNIALVLGTILSLIVINFFLSKLRFKPMQASLLEPKEDGNDKEVTQVNNIDHSIWVSGIFVFLGAAYLVVTLGGGKSLDLNAVILIFILLGVIAHKNLHNYQQSFRQSLNASSGIILQFPLYGGIMGMMNGSGLAVGMSSYFVGISSPETFLLNTYISAGILNFFVPSGGGQWVIQGPIILSAAKEFGVDFSRAATAIAWGDAWSNMIQPFWALPLLAIAQIELKDIMSYLIIIFIGAGAVASIIFLFSGVV